MDKTKIYYNKKVKLTDAVMIVGLPGIGNVGSLVGRYLKTEFNAEKFGTLYSPHFPHQVIMTKKGGMRLVSNRFYRFKNKAHGKGGKGGKNHNGDIVLLVGDTQAASPEGQYEVNEKIIQFFKHIGGKTVYTIGGYNINNQYVHTPRVFGVASNKTLRATLSKSGIIFGKASGMIWGSAGLLPAFAKKHNLNSACIMGETGLLEMDANSAKSVLEVLSKVLGMKINLENIDKIKQETEKMLKNLEDLAKHGEGGTDNKPSSEGMTYIR